MNNLNFEELDISFARGCNTRAEEFTNLVTCKPSERSLTVHLDDWRLCVTTPYLQCSLRTRSTRCRSRTMRPWENITLWICYIGVLARDCFYSE